MLCVSVGFGWRYQSHNSCSRKTLTSVLSSTVHLYCYSQHCSTIRQASALAALAWPSVKLTPLSLPAQLLTAITRMPIENLPFIRILVNIWTLCNEDCQFGEYHLFPLFQWGGKFWNKLTDRIPGNAKVNLFYPGTPRRAAPCPQTRCAKWWLTSFRLAAWLTSYPINLFSMDIQLSGALLNMQESEN